MKMKMKQRISALKYSSTMQLSTLNTILYFPFFLNQKLLVKTCTHHTKKVFGDSKEKPLVMPVVDTFTVNGKASPTIYDESVVDCRNLVTESQI